ncbi:hypothetical protein KF728_23625 [Candidatus Obscuribacterales bacterium]|nr:hypothetical protein [Candidatus Obscuribacterales bacterium]
MTVNASAQQSTAAIAQERVRTARPTRGTLRRRRSVETSVPDPLVADYLNATCSEDAPHGTMLSKNANCGVEPIDDQLASYHIPFDCECDVRLGAQEEVQCGEVVELNVCSEHGLARMSFSMSVVDVSLTHSKHKPISVDGLTHHGVGSESTHECSLYEEQGPTVRNLIGVNDETNELLQEFEELWVDTYPHLIEAIDQVTPNSVGVLVENAIAGDSSPVLSDDGRRQFECVDSSSESADMQLGRLLQTLGIVSPDALEAAISIANETSISVDRALIMSGHLSGRQLQWTVQIHTLLRENVISLQKAARVADLMSSKGMTIQRALNCVDSSDALQVLEKNATRIGDLLTAAELISEEELEDALMKADYFGIPLGRYLSISNLITAQLLESITNVQRYVRQGRMQKADAVVAIKRSARRQHELRKNGSADDADIVPLHSVRLGELLTLAGVVSELQLDTAVEMGLRNNSPVGEILVSFGYVTQLVLDSALTLQALVAQGGLALIEAVYALIDVHHHGLTLAIALKRNQKFNDKHRSLSFEQFMESVELVSATQVEEAIETARRSPSFVSKALVASGVVAESAAQVALLCHFYVRERMLTTEEAMLLFKLCHRTGLSVEDGIQELGLIVRVQRAPGSS